MCKEQGCCDTLNSHNESAAKCPVSKSKQLSTSAAQRTRPHVDCMTENRTTAHHSIHRRCFSRNECSNALAQTCRSVGCADRLLLLHTVHNSHTQTLIRASTKDGCRDCGAKFLNKGSSQHSPVCKPHQSTHHVLDKL